MILEFVIGTLAQQVISRYADKGLTFFDAKVLDVLTDAADGSPEAVAKADKQLAEKFLEHPDQAAELLDLVLEPPVDAEVAPGTQLKKYRSVVRGAFDVTHTLPGRRAAIPGWFHGADCVALLDARLSPYNSWSSEISGSWQDDAKPQDLAGLDSQQQYLLFRNESGGILKDQPPGRPRVLIIEVAEDATAAPTLDAASPSAATALADRLSILLADRARGGDRSRGAGGIGGSKAGRGVLGEAGVDLDTVRYVERIYQWRIRLSRPASADRQPGETIGAHIERRKDPSFTEVERPITGAAFHAGVRAMKASLRAEVLALAKEQALILAT